MEDINLESLDKEIKKEQNPEIAIQKHQEALKELRVLLYDEIHSIINTSQEMTSLKKLIQEVIDKSGVSDEVTEFSVTVDLDLRVELERSKYGKFVNPEEKKISSLYKIVDQESTGEKSVV